MSSENRASANPESSIGQNLLQISGPALIAPAAGLIIAVLLAIFILSTPAQDRHEQQMIDSATSSVEARINGREEQLTAAATSIRLTQLIATDDEAERTLEEARLRKMIPDAIRVRLFKLREAKVDQSANPPFGYTSVDMIDRVEIGQPVRAEAVNAQGRWLLSLAAPIRALSDPTIRGSLFIYLDPIALADTLDDGQQGHTRILQTIAVSKT